MKKLAMFLALMLIGMGVNTSGFTAAAAVSGDPEKLLTELSRQKWQWMADKNVGELEKLFDGKAVFVHMGGSMTKDQEIQIIKSGRIEYKQADVQEISASILGDTAIVLSNIQLFALVGGNEARNPFTVTETYIRRNGEWKLAALAFTRRLTPP